MNKYYFISFLLILLCVGVSCSDPYKLNDEASVKGFNITEALPSGVEFNESIVQDTIVYLQLTKGRYDFPISVKAEVVTAAPHQRILNLDLSQPIVFKSLSDTKEFYVTSESGLPRRYVIVMKKVPDPDDNDVEYFSCGSDVKPAGVVLIDQGSVISNEKFGEVVVTVEKGDYPLSFTPTIQISQNATSSIELPQRFTFNSYSDTTYFYITSQSGKTKPWIIYLRDNQPQLSNNDFAEWAVNPKTGCADPVGWATANNFMVCGTTQYTDPEKGSVAKLTTGKVNLVKQITAGSVFLGKFVLDIGQMSNPPMMTWQGISFIGRPTGISVDLKYTPGPQLEKSENGQFVSISGSDQGKVTVELLYYNGDPAKFEYHGFKNTTGVEVVARYEERLSNTNGQWVKKNYSLTPYITANQPNYISVVFSSGADGDKFIGAEGSTLLIDNVLLNYSADK